MIAIISAVSNSAIAQNKTFLTALFEKNTKTVKLRWRNITDAVSYTLQSSKDDKNFTDIFILRAEDLLPGDLIKYSDYKAAEGKNYYRLKIYRRNNFVEILPSIIISNGITENVWVVYPIPVGPVLNVQYNGNNSIDGVITVTIQSVTSGTVFTRLRLASTTRKITIPISNIGKGTYDIRIYVSNEIAWSQRVVKY